MNKEHKVIFKEMFSMSDSISILFTLFLPMLSVFATRLAIKSHNKIPDYIDNCVALFVIVAVSVVSVVAGIKMEWFALMIVALVFANFIAQSFLSFSQFHLLCPSDNCLLYSSIILPSPPSLTLWFL